MSELTGKSVSPYVAREAGEALTVAKMAAVKVADGEIYVAADESGLIGTGIVQETTAAGDKAVIDYACYWVDNSSTSALTYANIGGLAYVEDEDTVCKAAGSTFSLIAGKVIDVDSTYGVLVDFSEKSADTASAASAS